MTESRKIAEPSTDEYQLFFLLEECRKHHKMDCLQVNHIKKALESATQRGRLEILESKEVKHMRIIIVREGCATALDNFDLLVKRVKGDKL